MALISMLSAVQGVFIVEIRSVFAKPLETQVEVNIWRKGIRHASLESIVFSLIDTNMYFLVLGILTTLLKIECNRFKRFGYKTVSKILKFIYLIMKSIYYTLIFIPNFNTHSLYLILKLGGSQPFSFSAPT
jgi:hypothetical protein